jgi:hypothetical protein
MRIARPALALALVASVAAAGAAGAVVKNPAPQPVCKLIVDDAGDASLQAPIPSDDSIDLTGADLASDTKNVTAVLRIKNLGATSPLQVTGRNYYFEFTPAKAQFPVYFSYEEDFSAPLLGGVFSYGDLEPGTGGVPTYTRKGDATGVIDSAKNEIRISVPTSAVQALGNVKAGSKISSLSASTTAVLGVLVADVDTAEATKPYVAGYPSCVKPGK